MMITSDFEGGRIELKASNPASEGVLRIPTDVIRPMRVDPPEAPAGALTSHTAGAQSPPPVTPASPPPARGCQQWFAFDAHGEIGKEQRFRIENAGECTFGDAFGGLYRVFASNDDESWFRVPTTFANGVLSFSHAPERERVRYAYYPPYSSARLARLLIEVHALGLGSSRALTKTERGGELHVIEMGATPAEDPRHIWIIAQQHPGEPMAGWFVEGMVERLCSHDAVANALLARARLHIVPRMNPDGCALANHRTNALGVDLNRQWAAPSDGAPEVRAVREAMRATGVSFFLDAHGDERLPYVFTQLPDRHPARPERVAPLETKFEAAFKAHSPDFQSDRKYPYMGRDKPNLAIASTWAQNTFSTLAATLEMPFSDNANAPSDEGWSTDRSKRLGSALCEVLAEMVEDLTRSEPLGANEDSKGAGA